jgi:hypothetical protein
MQFLAYPPLKHCLDFKGLMWYVASSPSRQDLTFSDMHMVGILSVMGTFSGKTGKLCLREGGDIVRQFAKTGGEGGVEVVHQEQEKNFCELQHSLPGAWAQFPKRFDFKCPRNETRYDFPQALSSRLRLLFVMALKYWRRSGSAPAKNGSKPQVSDKAATAERHVESGSGAAASHAEARSKKLEREGNIS